MHLEESKTVDVPMDEAFDQVLPMPLEKLFVRRYGPIPAIGVPSASAVAHGRYPGAAYNLFSIARDSAAWRCEQTIRGIDDSLRVRQLQQIRLT